MMCQKLRKKKISFNSLNCGLQRTTLLLVVLLLGLSPLAALPWRAVSKLELKDQVVIRSDQVESSQSSSLQNSNEASNQALNQVPTAKQVLTSVDGLLETTSMNQIKADSDLNMQIYLTGLLAKDNIQITNDYAEKCDEFDEMAIDYNKLQKELYGPKFITEVSGTYNFVTGIGVGAAIGMKVGHGSIMKLGASVPLQTVLNPPQLANLNNYDFQATMGWEW